MSKELAKTYDPSGIEDKLYQKWLDKKYFHAEVDHSKTPFTIVIPPPNITGQLHMGHALDNTMQDILIRFKRMQGYNALWQPGTDHASIATEVKIIEKLREEGIDKHDLGRDKFLERAWDWKKEYGGRIISQLKKMGSSCDWDRERFTMDEGCNKAVTEVFVKMHEKGYIYKGSRIINWCPVCNTSISDAEVEYQEQAGHFWHIKYPLMNEDGTPSTTEFLTFATTRPETMLGDTAVAIHPEDERYQHLIGRSVMLPLMNREIPIVTDTYVDREFGTGVVKITPAHDPNDFEVGKRHDLPIINVMNDDATINKNGGRFAGMDRYEARKAIVEELDQMGLLVKIEDHVHNVGTHDRCKTTIEPLVKEQWFVKMDELIKPAVEAVKNGEIKLIPERMEKTYFNWTDNIRDWCISRQLWWGHRIPAYYCDECGEVVVAKDAPGVCPKCGCTHLTQDPDTLDTWFSSALWPFETLGWPEQTEDLKYFYPTDVLVTGYDIIFFWVIRMIFSGYEQMGEKPFKTVLFHGLVRDSQGRKMSKSLGNGIDPLEVIDQYGADALRLTLITGNAPGNDMRFYYERVENSRNFANKVWNASRFIMMNMDQAKEKTGKEVTVPAAGDLQPVDKWILSKLNTLVKDATENMESFELGIAVQKVYDFIWDEFCDWYIEMVKPRLYNSDDTASQNAALWTLKTVLLDALKLLHPYMPFITEEIFCTIQNEEETIMISKWPEYSADRSFAKEEKDIEIIKDAVRGIRNIRTEMNVAPSRKASVYVVSEEDSLLATFTEGKLFFASLAYANEVTMQKDKSGIAQDAVSVVIPGATLYIPFAELVDIAQEIERLKKEQKRLEGELNRSKGMLSNERFISKAPEAKIAEEKEKLAKYEQMMTQVTERLEQPAVMKITTYEQAAEYVLNLPKFTPDFTLDDTGRHLRKLGNPDGKLHIIHVAGTNGKGSVCAYMQSILESAGYQTAVFTSPHLVDVRERFVIRGRMVTKEDFLQTFLQVQDSLAEECSEGGKVYCPNFYEYLFFMAMLLFSKADVDYCILETGLGGRLDATNAVGKKDLAVITKISLDHVAVLGDTVEQIAGEKAGILKAGAPIVFADTQESVSNIFRNRARELEISAYCVSKNDYAFLEFHNKTIDFSLHTRYYGYVRLSLQSQAKYQMENAALAVRAIEILDGGRTISVENIIRGVHDCVWSGRMEEILPDVYVDGAHNADGINAFLETVAADNCSGKRMLLFGVMQDKDYPHMMASLLDSGLFEYLAVTRLRTGRSAALEDIRKLIENRKQSVSAYSLHDSVDTAWRELRKQQDPGDRIYIAGSLYLVGEIKELLEYD